MAETVVVQSAVRLPTPPLAEASQVYPSTKRKRSPPSRSPSPRRRPSPPRGPALNAPVVPDVDPQRAMERERQLAERLRQKEGNPAAPTKPVTAEEKQAAAKAEYQKLLSMRSGGTYIPPARLRALQAQITDKSSKEYQRMAWEALKKSINGLINKINVSNIKHIVPELFGENLVRGRGLFCRSIMKAQAASLPFTPIYAAMAAIVNTKLPQVGELLLHRLVVQFRKAFKRNDKAVCLSSTTFISHLCNQQVAHETIAAQILLLLLNKPTDDSVEIAVGLTREVGQHLEEMSGPIAVAVFDRFRDILHEADIDKRVQYMIEVLFQVRKDRYKDNPAIKEDLDLVEEEDQITHMAKLDDEIEVQDGLNIFKFDPEWEEHEEAYRKLKAEILGEAVGSDEGDEYETDDSSDDEEAKEERALEIKDESNTNLVNLRRTIYLTIMSSIDFEECCHKLMKVDLPPGQESELPSMVIECCSQERTYSKFYGLIGERFAKLNRLWSDLFEASFAKYYDTIHRYETNRLRNIARFFGHLISSNAIGWHVLSVIHLNEEETTSSSRIFIKILFQDLAEALGMLKLQSTLRDDMLRSSFEGLFPKDNPRNTRFSINYFTSVGMGAVTEDMREHLKNLPKPTVPTLPAPTAQPDSDTASSYSSYSSNTGSSRSYSHSRSPSIDGRAMTRRTPSIDGHPSWGGAKDEVDSKRQRVNDRHDNLGGFDRSRGRVWRLRQGRNDAFFNASRLELPDPPSVPNGGSRAAPPTAHDRTGIALNVPSTHRKNMGPVAARKDSGGALAHQRLPADHPLMEHLQELKAKKGDRRRHWAQLVEELGEDFLNPASYDNQLWTEEEGKADDAIAEVMMQIRMAERGMPLNLLDPAPDLSRPQRSRGGIPRGRGLSRGRRSRRSQSRGPKVLTQEPVQWDADKKEEAVYNWMQGMVQGMGMLQDQSASESSAPANLPEFLHTVEEVANLQTNNFVESVDAQVNYGHQQWSIEEEELFEEAEAVRERQRIEAGSRVVPLNVGGAPSTVSCNNEDRTVHGTGEGAPSMDIHLMLTGSKDEHHSVGEHDIVVEDLPQRRLEDLIDARIEKEDCVDGTGAIDHIETIDLTHTIVESPIAFPSIDDFVVSRPPYQLQPLSLPPPATTATATTLRRHRPPFPSNHPLLDRQNILARFREDGTLFPPADGSLAARLRNLRGDFECYNTSIREAWERQMTGGEEKELELGGVSAWVLVDVWQGVLARAGHGRRNNDEL
ncbi:MAG: pre-mRNA-splicing factor cwc22 [Piccolia ochrophora]|nr:MAG: pre-mRNA-splicing factor cwc22 [Piccolia ochrophora]